MRKIFLILTPIPVSPARYSLGKTSRPLRSNRPLQRSIIAVIIGPSFRRLSPSGIGNSSSSINKVLALSLFLKISRSHKNRLRITSEILQYGSPATTPYNRYFLSNRTYIIIEGSSRLKYSEYIRSGRPYTNLS